MTRPRRALAGSALGKARAAGLRAGGLCASLLLGLGAIAHAEQLPAAGADLPHAERAARPTVLVLEGSAPDWVRRVRGQLSDLPATITSAPGSLRGLSEAELGERLRELAAAHGATLVAWFSAPVRGAGQGGSDAASVSIWFAESGRAYTRRVAARWAHASAADRSGALELAALSVRSAVRSLILDPASDHDPFGDSAEPKSGAGGSGASAAGEGEAPASSAATARSSGGEAAAASEGTGTETPDRAESTAPTAPPAAASSKPAAAPEEEPQLHISLPTVLDRSLAPDTAAGAEPGAHWHLDLHWSTELGVVGRLYGEPALGAAAFEAGVHAASGAVRVGVLGQWTLPNVSELQPAQLEVRRYAFVTEGQYAAWSAGAWSVRPLARVGLALIRRQSDSDDPRVAAQRPQTFASPVLACGAITEYRLSERLGLSLRGVLHWEPLAPRFTINDQDGNPIASVKSWPIQPAAEVAGIWYW